MILADTSAWVEFLRRTGSDTDEAMRRHLGADDVATTDVVLAEMLSGTTDQERLTAWRRAVDACTYLSQEPYVDAVEAAHLYRACRAAGESPRQLSDCFVAAVAIRHDVAVLHRDRAFTVLARHSALSELSG